MNDKKPKKKIKVLAFGAFDVLHPGHLNFFKQAKALGDELHVVIGRDSTIEALKGQKPWDNENIRLEKVSKVPEVTKAYLGRLDDKFLSVKDHSPDLICLGYDQMSEDDLTKQLEKRGIKCKIVQLNAFHPNKYKSSIVKKELEGNI